MAERLQPITITTSTVTLDKRAHGETTILLSRAAGIAVTLPASAGDGTKFRLAVHTTVTSNSTTIKVANSTDVMQGVAWQAADGGSTVGGWETAASSDTITFDGSTTGGIKGDWVELTDLAAGFWQVEVFCSGTGTEATPFSATV